jgi:hypothetical protein
VHAFDQLLDGHGLVACGRVRLKQLKGRAGVADELAIEWHSSDL